MNRPICAGSQVSGCPKIYREMRAGDDDIRRQMAQEYAARYILFFGSGLERQECGDGLVKWLWFDQEPSQPGARLVQLV